ncbi:cyclic nucleotide-gated ion channel 1-like [Juglans microcarpa x Juglans regia]|uniref:cyclic nucleotide-gated ion channel 1-like n=1 Tax=Juglans microcarpa x Juglans regia TaxID=2249226 RepID=UPI001B7F654E|nr:cyclic nucleotide-gated ion channel 1-like [Juglans microcarpa x Juglans regia]
MSYEDKKFGRDVCKDIERQGPKNDGIHSEMAIGALVMHPSMRKIISEMSPWWFHWDVAFLVVRVVAVAVDPLFLYLPVINEATKCITIDNKLKIIAICVRSLLDLIAFWELVPSRRGYTWFDYVSNILGILPFPQVLLPIIPKMSGSKFRILRKFLNAVVFLQYGPRIFSIYRLWRKVNQTIFSPTPTALTVEVNGRCKNRIPPKALIIVMKSSLNLYLYLVASHVLGAFWYFFSIERETTCWQLACEHDIGCSKTTSLDCDDGFGNYTFLNDYCSIEKPNTTLFDFGIFQETRQSGILVSMDFLQKTMFCFWWGLRNLSSLGQNLVTTPDFWENCFTVLISIFGLLLFLYFIGNLQVYMEWQASKELEEYLSKRSEELSKRSKEAEETKVLATISKWLEETKRLEETKWWETAKLYHSKHMDGEDKANIMRTKLHSIEGWISTIGLPDQLKDIIISYVTPILEDQKNVIDTENPFPHPPTPHRRLIKLHLCLPLLRTVPIFRNESEELLYEIICKFFKQVQYNENSYIVREREPLDVMIFVVKGIVWTYTSNHGDKTECLKKGDHFGRDIVEWALKSPGLSDLPLSTRTLKCHTKVETFCLKAGDLNPALKDIMSQYCSNVSHITQSDSK